MTQVGDYAVTLHYLKAVADMGVAAAKADGRAVVARMKAMPTDDDCFGPGRIREDGRALHPCYLFEAKTPSESKQEWDVAKLLATTPMEEAFRPLERGRLSAGEGVGWCSLTDPSGPFRGCPHHRAPEDAPRGSTHPAIGGRDNRVILHKQCHPGNHAGSRPVPTGYDRSRHALIDTSLRKEKTIMPFYERGDVRIHYEEAGSGFPLLVIPGGGLNSTIAGLASQSHPFNPFDAFTEHPPGIISSN